MNEKKQVAVSVIIPMYKCAQFVDEVLEEVCGQSFRDTEILCVLDGPDEEIEEKIRRRMEADSRVQCIVREHGGAGAARNAGLELASGKYVIFLDADDLHASNMLEKLVSRGEKSGADIVMCSYTTINYWLDQTKRNQGFDFGRFPEDRVINPREVEDYYASFQLAPWNKLIRRRLVEENKLQFSRTHIMNDVFFVVAAMTCARGVAVVREDLLTSRRYINPESISSNRARHTEDFVVVLKEVRDWLAARGLWKEYRETYYTLYLNGLHYQAKYDHNEEFVRGVAKNLSRDLPWRRMGNGELKDRLGFRLRRLEQEKNLLQDDIEALKTADNTGRKQQLHMLENRIYTFRRIRSVMKKEYGRDLGKRDNPFTALIWSLRSRGWKGTIQRIRERRQGEEVFSVGGAVCSGMLTAARTSFIFFLPFQIPVNTSRTEAVMEDLSLVVRCNGYYPFAASGEKGQLRTQLGPAMTGIWAMNKPIRDGEVKRIVTRIVPGTGIRFRINFFHPLHKDRKGTPADNNQPLSVMITGKIRLK